MCYRFFVRLAVATIAALSCFAAFSQPVPHGPWIAASHTAFAITGNVRLDDYQIAFQNGEKLPLAVVEEVPSRGMTLYKVTNEGNPILENTNTFCGEDPVAYLLAQVTSVKKTEGHELYLSVFTKNPDPVTLADIDPGKKHVIKRSPCGTFSYFR